MGFLENLEISLKGEWASPDPFSQKFSIVLKTPYKTLSSPFKSHFEEIFSYRVAAYSYRTVVEHAVVVRIFTLVFKTVDEMLIARR